MISYNGNFEFRMPSNHLISTKGYVKTPLLVIASEGITTARGLQWVPCLSIYPLCSLSRTLMLSLWGKSIPYRGYLSSSDAIDTKKKK